MPIVRPPKTKVIFTNGQRYPHEVARVTMQAKIRGAWIVAIKAEGKTVRHYLSSAIMGGTGSTIVIGEKVI